MYDVVDVVYGRKMTPNSTEVRRNRTSAHLYGSAMPWPWSLTTTLEWSRWSWGLSPC